MFQQTKWEAMPRAIGSGRPLATDAIQVFSLPARQPPFQQLTKTFRLTLMTSSPCLRQKRLSRKGKRYTVISGFTMASAHLPSRAVSSSTRCQWIGRHSMSLVYSTASLLGIAASKAWNCELLRLHLHLEVVMETPIYGAALKNLKVVCRRLH